MHNTKKSCIFIRLYFNYKDVIKMSDTRKLPGPGENKMGVMPIGKLLFTMAIPMVIAMLVATKGSAFAFGVVGVFGVISLVAILLFKPGRVKELDDKYRAAAGKVLDDVLVGRK